MALFVHSGMSFASDRGIVPAFGEELALPSAESARATALGEAPWQGIIESPSKGGDPYLPERPESLDNSSLPPLTAPETITTSKRPSTCASHRGPRSGSSSRFASDPNRLRPDLLERNRGVRKEEALREETLSQPISTYS